MEPPLSRKEGICFILKFLGKRLESLSSLPRHCAIFLFLAIFLFPHLSIEKPFSS
jgi:hypothetical protein